MTHSSQLSKGEKRKKKFKVMFYYSTVFLMHPFVVPLVAWQSVKNMKNITLLLNSKLQLTDNVKFVKWHTFKHEGV